MKNKKKIILISYDAFSEDNWDYAKKLPNLKFLMQNGAYTNKLKSVYPTLTYVVHSTLITGCYPDKHGIYHNTPFQPFVEEKNQEWFWAKNYIKKRTLFEEAYDRNLKVCSILWPVTAKAKIKYNIPEVNTVNNENLALKMLKNGNPLYILEMELKYGSLRKGISQPYLDNYTSSSAVNTIKNKNVDLMMIHLIDLDEHKHNFGTKSNEIFRVIERMDKRIGELIKSVKKAKKMDDTIFVIVGDHGQLDVNYKIHLNNLLKDAGLIYYNNGKLDYKAYFQSTGGCAYLHAKDSFSEKKAIEIVYKAIKNDLYGILKVIDKNELAMLRAPQVTNYVIEAKVGYSFVDDIAENIIVDLKSKNKAYATHGYLPSNPNYLCNLVISGKGIKNNFFINDVEMVDIAPTIGKLLGLNFKCDGKVLNKIFDDNIFF